MTGGLSGLNDWPGLRLEMDALVSTFWEDRPWSGHLCDDCWKEIEHEGQSHMIQCVVVDGIKGTRMRKCAMYGCQFDLPGMGETRYEDDHGVTGWEDNLHTI